MKNRYHYRECFIREFGELLVKYGKPHYETMGVARMELVDDGNTVRVWWDNGDEEPDSYRDVNVAGDSLLFCIHDIIRQAF